MGLPGGASCVGIVYVGDAAATVAPRGAIANGVRALAEAAAIGGEDGVDHVLLFGVVRVNGQHLQPWAPDFQDGIILLGPRLHIAVLFLFAPVVGPLPGQ